MAKKQKMELTAGQIRDMKLGGRVRRQWNKILKVGESCGLKRETITALVVNGWLEADDEDRKAIATKLGIDIDSLLEFAEAIAAMVAEIMASCA